MAEDSPRVPDAAAELLHAWLASRLPDEALAWLDDRCTQIRANAPDRLLHFAFSTAPRKVGKADLELAPPEVAAAAGILPGWNPAAWSADQAARTLLLLSAPATDAAGYAARIEPLFLTADVAESVALYQALPLLPFPEVWVARAAEGLRSSITAVFQAVALDNPFPAAHFDEAQWNQMVLKAIFVGAPLERVVGLDARRNATLARMSLDYVDERRAAGRTFTPALWRLVAPYPDARATESLQRALDDPDPAQREAAHAALHVRSIS